MAKRGETVAFSDRPEVKAFQTFLSSDTWANDKADNTPAGGWVSANTGLDIDKLVSPIDKLSAETLQDPKAVFRFDGSDQMPAAVGSAVGQEVVRHHPVRRLRHDAGRGRLRRLLEAGHQLDHGPEHQGDGRQDRGRLAVGVVWPM